MRSRSMMMCWLARLAMSVAVTSPHIALAQQAALTVDATPEASSTVEAAPDPLTPRKIEHAPQVAPGVTIADPKPLLVADPIVTEVRLQLSGQASTATRAERADRDALAVFYAEGTGKAVWTSDTGLSSHGAAAVEELTRHAADFGLDSAAFAHLAGLSPKGSPTEIAEAEIKISLASLKYARHARGGRIDPSSLGKAIDREAQLYEPRSVLAALAASEDPAAYLRSVHPQHPQFQRLQQALVDLRAGGEKAAALGLKGISAADAETRILINMERWRWFPDDMGELHVWNNVPEQVTRVVREGKTVLTERIVVGKPTQQTPDFSAPMKFVIFHPSWGVPEGIKTNEIGPMLKRASALGSGGGWFFGESEGAASRALKRHELRVIYHGREVNPDSINWNSVDVRQFQFTQPPSARNVLGVVKFRFPNKFDVYMHDTSDRHLFSQSQRAFSHGCMRVQNPIRFAEVILAYDKGWSAERVNSFVPRGATSDITLDKRIPVHITYFTAAVGDDGKLRFFSDIYGRDSRVASTLAGKHVAMASIATPNGEGSASAEPRNATRRSADAARPASQKKGAVPRAKAAREAGSGDPFGGLSAN